MSAVVVFLSGVSGCHSPTLQVPAAIEAAELIVTPEQMVDGSPVRITVVSNTEKAPEVKFGETRVPMFRTQVRFGEKSMAAWEGYAGVPLGFIEASAEQAEQGKAPDKAIAVSAALNDQVLKREVKVGLGAYRVRHLPIPSDKDPLTPAEQERNEAEKKEAAAIYATITEQKHWKGPWRYPVKKAIMTAPFGDRRFVNDSKEPTFHAGLDFRAPVGTPVLAPADGVVVLSKQRLYSGGSVIIDHGYGVFSASIHLSKTPLKVGTKVKAGQRVGYSGNTGRRTQAAHLHWVVMIQGTMVSPLEAMKLLR